MKVGLRVKNHWRISHGNFFLWGEGYSPFTVVVEGLGYCMSRKLKQFVWFYLFLFFIPLYSSYEFTILTNKDGETQYLEDYIKSGCVLFFLFSDQCVSCNQNFVMWNRLSQKCNFYVIGLVWNEFGLVNNSVIKNKCVKIWMPMTDSDAEKVVKKFAIDKNENNTVLIEKSGQIKVFKGVLSHASFFEILNSCQN